MDFELTLEQQALADAVAKLCTPSILPIGANAIRRSGFPEAFVQAVAEGGWLGSNARGLRAREQGITEAALFAHAVARSGAGMSGASAVHINLFGPHP